MFSMKLLLAFGVATGIVAQQCDVGDLGVADFSNRITVTNLSSGADAFVGVKTNHGQINYGISAGKSRTAIALAATRYTVKVVGHTKMDVDLDYYKTQLESLRSMLQDLTLDSSAPPDQILLAAEQLAQVQSALEQMNGSTTVQSCGGKLVIGETTQVTVKWTEGVDGTGFWVLDCG
jgi:hypothetical protein